MALKGAMKCVVSLHNPYEWGNIDNVYEFYKTRIIKQVGYHFQSMQLNIWGPKLSMTHIMQQGYIPRKPLMDSSWVMSHCHSTFGLNHLLSSFNCGNDFRLPLNNGNDLNHHPT
jgi:hypothetical protein